MQPKFGWVPDLPDMRDYQFAATVSHLPPGVDLRAQCSPVVDQGQLGSCTANAIAGAIEFDLLKQGKPYGPVSRLFIYYNERVMEHSVDYDSGAMIRDGIKSVAKQGVPPEQEWPYLIDHFTDKPPSNVYKDALGEKAYVYRKVANTVNGLHIALAANYPVVFGFTVYESFMSDVVAHTGVVPMPHSSEQVAGGHAVLAVGYDAAHKVIICRNSWGTEWGLGGYFVMPEAYFGAGLASDFWTITKVE